MYAQTLAENGTFAQCDHALRPGTGYAAREKKESKVEMELALRPRHSIVWSLPPCHLRSAKNLFVKLDSFSTLVFHTLPVLVP